MKLALSVVFLISVLSGCAVNSNVPPTHFYFGSYATTLYEYKKDPSEQTRNAHIAELRRIISYSGEHNLITPPGIHAELGQFLLKSGDQAAAINEFKAEQSLYPESEKLMSLMIDTAQG
ncbi:DUF4810 domain-containing protein [Marinobacter sp. C2H3]|uniref:DUF4810 domain-containing protein n=1 Tax=Marinobacter sp. C2H3 TaxID=3119003 RepID=UPI00300E8010